MKRPLAQTIAVALFTVFANVACTHGNMTHAAMDHAAMDREAANHARPPAGDPKTIHQPTSEQRALGIYQNYSDADIEFMTGMIPHHAQAVIMAGWAPSHGVRSDVGILCERIVVGQTDEIKSMQTWLRDRGQPVADAKSTRMHMKMNGVEHDMLMPGMLTEEEMAALDKARS